MKHQHHFIIKTAHGLTSKGVCKICGEEREFLNSLPARNTGFVPNSLKTGKIKRPNKTGGRKGEG